MCIGREVLFFFWELHNETNQQLAKRRKEKKSKKQIFEILYKEKKILYKRGIVERAWGVGLYV
eukprot:UN04152